MRPGSCDLCSDRFSPPRSQLAMCLPGVRHPRLLIPRLTRRPRGSLPVRSEISLNYSGCFRTDRILIRRYPLSRALRIRQARRIDRCAAQSRLPLAAPREVGHCEAAATRAERPSRRGNSRPPSGGSPKHSPHCWSHITDASRASQHPRTSPKSEMV